MNNIRINIYTSSLDSTKLLLNLDDNTVTLNNKKTKLNEYDIVSVINKILEITKEWEKIELINVNEYNKIEVLINFLDSKKEYFFKDKVPINMYKIYTLIEDLQENQIWI